MSEQKRKPDCALIGQDGNIFNLMGIASRTLRQNGMAEEAKEMTERIHACGSYGAALCIIGEYVNITSEDESEDECCDGEDEYFYEDDFCEDEEGGMDLC